jgi:hypothetical protein
VVSGKKHPLLQISQSSPAFHVAPGWRQGYSWWVHVQPSSSSKKTRHVLVGLHSVPSRIVNVQRILQCLERASYIQVWNLHSESAEKYKIGERSWQSAPMASNTRFLSPTSSRNALSMRSWFALACMSSTQWKMSGTTTQSVC